uniref:Uncharacterized protein n=1 Tax=Nelumbo nucifera TaxID=4432 RepID=A0A822Z7P6_NELNU|nr:TPA_asm: hypothetical protein HUJ06_015425 [Nelumbo nucifera]
MDVSVLRHFWKPPLSVMLASYDGLEMSLSTSVVILSHSALVA